MKFTDSPVIELKVRNALLSIEQDNGSMHVGTSVWPCSLVLVKFLERWSLTYASSPSTPNPYTHLLNFSGKRAIELGCGCGPAGMGLSLLGLDIILTDISPVMPALKRNLKRNKPILGKTLKTAQLYWNNPNQIKTLNPPFDFVIAADVVYIEESVGSLVSAMESLVADTGFVLLGYQLRSPEAHKLFWELCEKVFVIEKVPHEDLHPEYAYEEADVYVMTKKKEG
ncbi:Nicotinamide N-methyltransferase-like [Macleaya cordata]|uniref:Nicotinamide N-methyltransferase-like n=1 Tax=Macleaya cordata TaxID=56857 RepID=A0A200QL37_MACCD|nr:Nicotinamide N-methyltransferase-like [Macleaya cordata]